MDLSTDDGNTYPADNELADCPPAEDEDEDDAEDDAEDEDSAFSLSAGVATVATALLMNM